MSYAIVKTGGKQFRVEVGETVQVPKIEKDVDEQIELEAMLIGDGDTITIGAPLIEGVLVKATVVEHGRGDKIIVFKKKRRKQYKRKQGHRQDYTAIKIDSI